MWEITLIGKTRDIFYFEQLKSLLKSKYNSNVMVAITYNENLYCSIAVDNKKIIRSVKIKIYEIIIKIVKCEYFESVLNIFGNDKSLNAFILSSILKIDLSDEIEYAMDRFKLSKTIFIRPFVYFKLTKIVDIWHQIADYLNLNFSSQKQDILCLEFLKFIADNSQSRWDILYLEENLGELQLLDNRKNKLRCISKNDEIGILVNLIMYSPKRLVINCLSSLSDKISGLITYIFEDKLSVII